MGDSRESFPSPDAGLDVTRLHRRDDFESAHGNQGCGAQFHGYRAGYLGVGRGSVRRLPGRIHHGAHSRPVHAEPARFICALQDYARFQPGPVARSPGVRSAGGGGGDDRPGGAGARYALPPGRE